MKNQWLGTSFPRSISYNEIEKILWINGLVHTPPTSRCRQHGRGFTLNRPIVRKNGIPLYVQVKDRILSDIRTGVYQAGDKLPTERDLSDAIGVSRNTVSQAYHDLEADGVIASRQGRGTFVCDRDDNVRLGNRRELLKKVIDMALEESLQLGFTFHDFMQLAAVRTEQKAALLNRAQVVFIECNREQVEYLSRKLEFGGVHITPVVIDDLRKDGFDDLELVDSADLVVTTFFHFDEVQSLLGHSRTVLAIALDPELETIVKIARVPEDARGGLVCRSDNFAGKVRLALKQAGLGKLHLDVTTTADETVLKSFLQTVDTVIVSPGRRREVERLARPRQAVIEFVFRPDSASINLLRAALADIRQDM